MAPKKPVKIGLKKKNNTEEEQVEVQDVDTTIPPLSASCMESLEEIVGENEEVILYDDIVDVVPPDSLDLFEDEMDGDQDPDWVDPKPITKSILKNQPQPSTSKDQPEPTGTAPTLRILEPAKARSKNIIWAFFVIDDIKVPNKSGVGTCIEKGAKCTVPLEGAGGTILCNARLRQGGSTTSGLNSHLHSQHPKAWDAFINAKAAELREKQGAKRSIENLFDEMEGTPPSKRSRAEASEMSGVKALPKSPFFRDLKYEKRGRIQLQWELWMTEYWARMGFPWSKLDDPAHKEFWGKVNSKYHIKHSTTYSRAKLPLLFDQVKAAVDKKIQKDVQLTSGVGITADHWTSRNDDPYIGLTLHIISKDWTLDR